MADRNRHPGGEQVAILEAMRSDSYVLVTAAYNEGAFIENTIRSVISQEVPPAKWVIVSDGSTDNTDEIVRTYAVQYPFICLHRITKDHPRNFAAQVNAINTGIAELAGTEYDFIGNMDADVTMEPSYFRLLLAKFRDDPRLGLGGGMICEQDVDGNFKGRKTNSRTSVAHACQLFRKECFASVGGEYIPLPYGGPDTYAETTARMRGWHVESFEDLTVFHHRPTGSAGGLLKSYFRQGKMDYSLGALPLFEIFKLAKRVGVKPYLVGSVVRFAGFVHSYSQREQRAVPADFMNYLRSEQRRRLINLFRAT
jgi:glycosyltransferase involved in cell wall biosynthesis